MSHPQPDTSPPRYGAKIAAGASMLLAANLGMRVLALLSVAVLARLLTPEDFGLMALALVVIGFTQVVSQGHLENALIRHPAPEPLHYDTAFTLALLRAVLLAAPIYFAAPAVARLADEPALADILRWVALVPLIDGVKNPYFIEFSRQIRFVPQAATVVGSKFVNVAVAVALAFLWEDYRALLAGTIATSAAQTAITYAAGTRTPRLSLRRWRDIMDFGGWLTMAAVLNYVEGRSDFVMMGASLDAAQVGHYSIGDQIASVGTSFLAHPVLGAILPGLTAVSGDTVRFRAAYHKAQQMIVGLLIPIGIGSALVAREAVLVIAGPKWLPAVTVVEYLAPTMAFCLTGTVAYAIVMAKGETRLLFQRSLSVIAIKIPVLIILLYIYGFMGVLYARVLVGALQTFMMLKAGARLTGESMLLPLIKTWRSFTACFTMVAAVVVLEHALPSPGLAPAPNMMVLVAKAAVGATTFAVAHLALWLLARRPEGVETIVIALITTQLKRLKDRR